MSKQILSMVCLYAISPIMYGMENKTDTPAAGMPTSITVVAPETRARSSSLPHHKHSHSSSSSENVKGSTIKEKFEHLLHPNQPEATAPQKQGEQPVIPSIAAQPRPALANMPLANMPLVPIQPTQPATAVSAPSTSLIPPAPELAKKTNPTLWANIKNASPKDWARIVITALWDVAWGKKPEITHHAYHAAHHHHTNQKIGNFAEALKHQGKLVRNAYKYQLKRSASLATVAAAITAVLAYPSFGASASTATLGLVAGSATGLLSWFYHGRRAQLNEIAERHRAVVLHAIRADVTDQEAALAYNQVMHAGYWHSLAKFWPAGITDMSDIRDDVQDCYRVLERDKIRTELTHPIVPQTTNPAPLPTTP